MRLRAATGSCGVRPNDRCVTYRRRTSGGGRRPARRAPATQRADDEARVAAGLGIVRGVIRGGRGRGRGRSRGTRVRRRRRRGGRRGRRGHDGSRRPCGSYMRVARLLRRGRRRWRRRRRRVALRTTGQKPERVDVALRIARHANAEVDVRARELGRAARTHRADHVALADGRATSHRDRAEVNERRRVAVAGLDREREPVRRQGAGVRHGSRCGSAHRSARGARDVDAPADAAGVWVRVIERERAENVAVDRPRPRVGSRHGCDECKYDEQRESSHRATAFVV